MKLYNNDCLEVMQYIPDNSIDFILTDLPYGKTDNKWDSSIDIKFMWKEIKRIRKENTVIALFGNEPFSSHLRLSNINEYKYDWVWKKTYKTNFLNANKMPLRCLENILIFYKKNKYYPQNLKIKNKIKDRGIKGTGNNYITTTKNRYTQKFTNYPTELLEYKSVHKPIHPTQKPTELLEYLIKTYTLENEVVLDFTMGSGSTGVACVNTNRNFIGIELKKEYYNLAKARIDEKLYNNTS
tara:strand:+ start:79 stop:798 length:720 start_codon:yes stop_codon:yes gene_type:complete